MSIPSKLPSFVMPEVSNIEHSQFYINLFGSRLKTLQKDHPSLLDMQLASAKAHATYAYFLQKKANSQYQLGCHDSHVYHLAMQNYQLAQQLFGKSCDLSWHIRKMYAESTNASVDEKIDLYLQIAEDYQSGRYGAQASPDKANKYYRKMEDLIAQSPLNGKINIYLQIAEGYQTGKYGAQASPDKARTYYQKAAALSSEFSKGNHGIKRTFAESGIPDYDLPFKLFCAEFTPGLT